MSDSKELLLTLTDLRSLYSPELPTLSVQAEPHVIALEVFPSATRTALLALARRDITVPIGIDSVSAISLYDISSTSHSNRTSWKIGGSSPIAHRIDCRSEYLTISNSALSELAGTFGKSSSELKGATTLARRFDREVAQMFLKI
jgi:hypothetical protein